VPIFIDRGAPILLVMLSSRVGNAQSSVAAVFARVFTVAT